MKKSNKVSLKFCLSILLSVGAMVGMLGLFCTTPAMGQTTQYVLAEISSAADSKVGRSGKWTYELDEKNNTATLVSYNVIENLNPEWIHHDIDGAMRESFGYGLKVEIPVTIDDIPVVALGSKDGRQSIFSECGTVTEITFAEGSKVESIHKNAFKELMCLTNVVLPPSVKLIEPPVIVPPVISMSEHFTCPAGVT